ncbi:MAG: pseudaminic acid biosynthesis-associated methylase [Parcubacteria group bacterium]
MSKPHQLAEIWEKDFGDEYTNRQLQTHDAEEKLRENFWRELIKMAPDAKSYLEIGCNVGLNLDPICKAGSHLDIVGVEPNKYALKIATEKAAGRYNVVDGNIFSLSPDLRADLVFTCTVLIHISPKDLLNALNNLYGASNKYILIMEYYWPTVKEIEYRGLRNALWKQDFGALLQKNFDVNLIETGYLDARDGFDRTSWWLFEKK